jgi:DNA-binding NarL/FixJ family response regulator
MIHILIIDDHPVVRRGIKHILAESGDIVVAGEAGDGRTGLEILKKQSIDAVILDLTLPGESGLEIFDKIKELYKKIPVLFLSVYKEDQYAIRTIKAGAAGYLCKDSMAEVLVDAVRKIVSGGKYITPQLAEELAFHVESRETTPHESLSHREFMVFLKLAEGKNLKAIGEEMAISIKTVSTYKKRVFDKMNFLTNADLFKYAIQFGLIDTRKFPKET